MPIMLLTRKVVDLITVFVLTGSHEGKNNIIYYSLVPPTQK